MGAYLADQYSNQNIFSIRGSGPFDSINEFQNYPISKRHGYDLIKGHYANQLFGYVDPDCLKVTLLRDPIDRIVSHYYYAKRSPKHYLYSNIHKNGMSLEAYVASGISDELQNWYTTYFSGLTLEEAEKSPVKSVNSAVEAIIKYDIIGFLENLSVFTENLHNQARLRHKFQNQRVNQTEGRLRIADIQQSTIDIIKKINHLDVEVYKKLRSKLANS